MSSSNVSRIYSLIAEWEKEYSAGNLLSLEELCREQPELLDEVRHQLNKLQHFPDADKGDTVREKEKSPPQLSLSDRLTLNGHQGQSDEVSTVLPGFSVDTSPADSTRIPGYVITRELARGGMGRVLAGREERLDREVAIKVLLPGADAKRFITESRITARLPHPSIPPVYALGNMVDGSPFLAMKLVRGNTLSDELKQRSQPLEVLPRFLQIFEQIAQAVGFAHSQEIIHRDLKPANVMVGAFGEVQVMDWGLAKELVSKTSNQSVPQEGVKPLDSAGTTKTATYETETPNLRGESTAAGAIMGTPNYMAPEQARSEAVDARTDVFALGGILCSILTGKAVYVGASALDTIVQAADGDTTDALARLDACGADAEVISLAKRCLAVKPAERPADGQAVANLVAEYRQGVEERLKRAETERAASEAKAIEQAKRRRVVQVGAGVIAAVLFLGVIGTSIGFVWAKDAAERERLAKIVAQQAEALTAERLKQIELINNTVFDIFTEFDIRKMKQGNDPVEAVLAKKLIEAGKKLDEKAIADPMVLAKLRNRLGQTLFSLGEYPSTIGLFLGARQTFTTKLGANHPDTLRIMTNLAEAYARDGKLDLTLPLKEETLKLMKAELGADHPDTLMSMNNLASSYQDAGKLDKALGLYKETLNLRKAKLGADHPDTLRSMNNLALGYRDAGKLNLALPLWDETLKLMKVRLGTDHLDTLACMNNLALGYHAIGKLDLALPLYLETLKLMKAKQGNDHPDTLQSMGSLAMGYQDAGKVDLALPLLEETLKLSKARLGIGHPDTLKAMNNLASSYLDAGKVDLALPLLEETLKLSKTKLGADHPHTLSSMNNLALAYQGAKKLDLAVPLLEETLKFIKAKMGVDHPNTLLCMNNLASVYKATGKLDLAVPLLEETLKLIKVKLGTSHPNTLMCMNNLATCYRDAGKLALALSLYQEAAAGSEKRGFQHDGADTIVTNLSVCHERLNQFDQAEVWRRKWLAELKVRSGADSLPYISELDSLGLNLLQQNKWTNADAVLRECLTIHEKIEPDDWKTFNTQSMLGAALSGQKKYADAERLLLKGYEGMKAREKTTGTDTSRLALQTRLPEALDRLIQLYTVTNKPDEVKKWQAEKDKLPKPETIKK
ncbi:MAG TPA: serine/threonine-protein kinase [Gemmatales bacterium]|nr:serine/threonine-protein kinase [Gemmatales bacterium]